MDALQSDPQVEAALHRLEALGYQGRPWYIGPPEQGRVLLFISVSGMRAFKGASSAWAAVGEPGEVLAMTPSTLTRAHIEPLIKRLRIHFAHRLIIQWIRAALPGTEEYRT